MERTDLLKDSNHFISTEDFLTSISRAAVAKGYLFTFWRSPGQSSIHTIISKEKFLKKDFQIENSGSGFIYNPFKKETDEIFFFPADIYFVLEGNSLSVSNLSDNELDELLKTGDLNENIKMYYPGTGKAQDTTQKQYVDLVKKSIDAIKQGLFLKVVPSKAKTVSLDQFNTVKFFLSLCEAYPAAFVSFMALPDLGSWFCATPEKLLSLDSKGVFKTTALAGTQNLKKNTDIGRVAWKQKEIEEQALVSRYIINCFKKIRLREYEEIGPRTVAAGNLMHLKTDFEVDTKATNFPELASVMLHLLHPTSAVCGMPKDAAMAFLEENEGIDRRMYSGFMGPVGFEGSSEIFVNLRCMQIFEDSATLYAGAGVTADSVPEKEWEETEAKCQTLLKYLTLGN